MLLQKLGGLLLRRAANLADHDNALGLVVLEKHVQTVDKVGAVERITANA